MSSLLRVSEYRRFKNSEDPGALFRNNGAYIIIFFAFLKADFVIQVKLFQAFGCFMNSREYA